MAVNQADAAPTERMDEGSKDQSPEAAVQPPKSSVKEVEQKAQGKEERRTNGDNRLAGRDTLAFMSPFSLLQRFFSDDRPGLFEALAGRFDGTLTRSVASGSDGLSWTPKTDVVQRGNELVIRADLPGVDPDDVVVEIGADAITVSGERRWEHAEEHGSIYRVERAYGAFLRQIPLPERAITDQAKASFKNGVLEIRVPMSPERGSRGRRLDVSHNQTAQETAANVDGTSHSQAP